MSTPKSRLRSEIRLDQDPRIIAEFPEIACQNGECFNDRSRRVMNNFHLRIPHYEGIGWYRHMAIVAGDMDKTHIEVYEQDGVLSYERRRLHSEFFWNRTHRQYFSDLDQAVIDSGQDFDRLIRAIDIFVARRFQRKILCSMIWYMLLPVYIEMRRKGYIPYDLNV